MTPEELESERISAAINAHYGRRPKYEEIPKGERMVSMIIAMAAAGIVAGLTGWAIITASDRIKYGRRD